MLRCIFCIHKEKCPEWQDELPEDFKCRSLTLREAVYEITSFFTRCAIVALAMVSISLGLCFISGVFTVTIAILWRLNLFLENKRPHQCGSTDEVEG